MPDEVSVRQARILPPAFFRFLLTKDTLALGYVLGAITRTWDFHPLENAHTEHTKKGHPAHIGDVLFYEIIAIGFSKPAAKEGYPTH